MPADRPSGARRRHHMHEGREQRARGGMRGDQRQKRVSRDAPSAAIAAQRASSDHHQRDDAERAVAAVAHDLELALARVAAAEAVGDVGERRPRAGSR